MRVQHNIRSYPALAVLAVMHYSSGYFIRYFTRDELQAKGWCALSQRKRVDLPQFQFIPTFIDRLSEDV